MIAGTPAVSPTGAGSARTPPLAAGTRRKQPCPVHAACLGTIVRRAQTSHDLGFTAVASAAVNGEHWALTELFRAYQPSLLRYLRSQEPGMAEDLAGDVWFAVARQMATFVGDEAGFRGWLFTIARRRLIEHRRKAQRRRTDPVPHDRLDGPTERAGDGDPAAVVVDLMGARSAIENLIADLSPDQAEAVLLRVVAGFDVPEVAQMMDRSPGSVRVLCHRALRRLESRYGEGALAE